MRKLSKEYGVMVMSEFPLDFGKHIPNKPVALPMGTHIRVWMGIIQQADHIIGCDSVGQHIAHAYNKSATVVIGSTYPINTSFPNDEKFDFNNDKNIAETLLKPTFIYTDLIKKKPKNNIHNCN